MSYKGTFQDRVGQAADAKRKALEQLRARPPVDESVLAERRATALKREAADREKRAAKKVADQAAADAKAALAEAAAAAEAANAPKSEAERKAARDARYAARKNRK